MHECVAAAEKPQTTERQLKYSDCENDSLNALKMNQVVDVGNVLEIAANA